ncbi:Flavodoxin 1 [Helicobacter heilmannii]|uniref:Flavodoxin n=1 Tax=Helicobacter heilmannii TaxID=35817 RepID=A0A0K2XPT7_HELHE|nr:flavodoxin [Helicobacter heilmannii]CCM11471.1 Flavodoxin 1 [Helicobacter heilmannii ASB1.4]CRF47619.1 Flavodoxin 1 [Helicobacter heilmannii]CRF50977.1 Flavodoxin 1 [Helicobacter heilmannii]CRI34893.1 Flavodoxin 1 [Helicobacter heilmannii]BDQ26493.1 flavodoxin [Helicobacter heilmannii]
MAVGIFYGTDSGNSETISNKIAEKLGGVKVYDVAKASKSDFDGCSSVVLVAPTAGAGDLQSDWEEFLGTLSDTDFANKTIALVGLGDQDTYSETFAEGIFHIYEKAKAGKVVGFTSTDGYNFEASRSVEGGKFVGLVLDEDNQDDLTDSRIDAWIGEVKGQLS